MKIILEPVDATAEVMLALEAKGVIRRICPGKDVLAVEKGESRWVEVYSAGEKFGPHKLIAVTINSAQPQCFSYHSDAEDFMLIDRPGTADLILTVALCRNPELEAKIRDGLLSAEDFIAIRCKSNDPQTSFFTMNPYFAHVETCFVESESPPSFYVGESKHLDENHVDFMNFTISIQSPQGGLTP